MKTAAALLLSFFALTAAAAPCKPPKIIGLDYHTARAMLIKAGCYPVHQTTESDGGRPRPEDAELLGYHEATHSSQGSAGRRFHFPGFTVYANGCEDLTDRRFNCIVRSIDHH
jgi:hypothetical protein